MSEATTPRGGAHRTPLAKRIIIGGFVAGCVVAILLALAVQIGRNMVIDRIQGVADRTGRTITVGAVEVHLDGTIDIYDLWISDPENKKQGAVSVQHLHGAFSIPRLLKGSLRPEFVHTSGISIRVELNGDGSTSLDDLRAEIRRIARMDSEEVDTDKSGISILPQLVVEDIGIAVRSNNWKAIVRTPQLRFNPTQDGGATAQAEGTLTFDDEERSWAASGWLSSDRPRRVGFQVVFDEPTPIPTPGFSFPFTPRLKTVDWNPDKGLTLRGLMVKSTEADPRYALIERVFFSTNAISGWPSPADINQIVVLGFSGGDDIYTVSTREMLCTLSPARERSLARRVQQIVAQDVHLHRKNSALRSIAITEVHAGFHGFDPEEPLGGMKQVLVQEASADFVLSAPGEGADLESYVNAFNQALEDLSDPSPVEDTPKKEIQSQTQTTRGLASILAPIQDINIALHRGSFRIHDVISHEQWALFTGLDASWVPNTRPGENRFHVSAHLIDGLNNPSALEIRGVLDGESHLRSLDIESSSGTLAQFLPTVSDKLRSAPDAEATIEFHMEPTENGQLKFDGRIQLDGVGIDWWRIAHVPIENIDLDVVFEDIIYNPVTDTLRTTCLSEAEKEKLDAGNVSEPPSGRKRKRCRADGRSCRKSRQCCSRRCSKSEDGDNTCCTPKELTLRIGEVETKMHFVVENLRDVPRIQLGLKMPRHSCASAIASIPTQLIPRLAGMRTAGYVEFALDLSIDLADSYSLKLDLDGDLNSCVVLTLGKKVRVGRLLDDDFVHTPVVDGKKLPVQVGPGTLSWTPYFQIPNYVRMAAVATEDLDFFKHEGFKLSLIKRAMKLDLDRGRYVYGGSTISQQLVKNLFLTREKTLARKMEEAIITWNMERMLSKQRILELYLNCIEYGPKIYGIRNAARHYFGKEPAHLTPLEGAFLMGLKPCPSCGYRQWRRKGVNKRWQKKLRFIMTRLMKRGWITEEQFQVGVPFLPAFYYPTDGYIHQSEPK